MRRPTTIRLDPELLEQAADALGTRGPSSTVQAALHEVVTRARRRRLAARELEDLTTSLADLRLQRYPPTDEMSASEWIEEDRGGGREE